MAEFSIALDATQAGILRDVLRDLGEQQAAGAPMAPLSVDESIAIGRVIELLERALRADRTDPPEVLGER